MKIPKVIRDMETLSLNGCPVITVKAKAFLAFTKKVAEMQTTKEQTKLIGQLKRRMYLAERSLNYVSEQLRQARETHDRT